MLASGFTFGIKATMVSSYLSIQREGVNRTANLQMLDGEAVLGFAVINLKQGFLY